ncbi:MAG: PCRF domain-containing protein, partial [Clostridia bacterium]|nr:PCRF domain-containing protein [Clostridia bacterium]
MLQFEELKKALSQQEEAIKELKDALGLERLREEVEMLEHKAAEPGFWDNMESAQKVLQKTSALKAKDEQYTNLVAKAEDCLALIEMGDEAEDLSLLPDAENEIKEFLHYEGGVSSFV